MMLKKTMKNFNNKNKKCFTLQSKWMWFMDVMIFVLDKRQTILIKIKLISKIKTD